MSKIITGILAVGVIGAGVYIYVKNKGKSLVNQFDKIKTSVSKISNLNGKFNDFKPFITFDLDLKFTNPTDQEFNANGVVVKLQRIVLYDKNNKAIGTATPNISAINIRKKSSTIIKQIPVNIQLTATVLNIVQIIKDWKINPANFRIETVIDVLGMEYVTVSTIDVKAFDFKTF